VRRFHRYLAGAALLSTAVAVPPSASTEALTPPRFVSGWIPYWEGDWTRPFDQSPQILREVSPMAFEVDDVTDTPDPLDVWIRQTESTTDLNAIVAKAGNLPVIPAVFDSTGNNVLAQVLADPARRAAHIQQLMTIVNDPRFDGIDLDYENFAFNDSADSKALVFANWPVFLKDLKAAMLPSGKILSVTVPPVWTKTTVNDSSKSPATCSFDLALTTESCRGYRMYNWPATIGDGVVDRFRIMVYDWSVGLAGPIAPRWWFEDVLALVRTRIPAGYWDRVQLGVPTYGRNWAKVESGTCPDGVSMSTRSVQMSAAASLASSKGVTPQLDLVSGETTFSWTESFTGPLSTPPPFTPGAPPNVIASTDPAGMQPAVRLRLTTCTVRRTVWVPDEFSVANRAILASEGEVGGIVMWAIGYETTALWNMLAGI
jgi:spore germination protein